MSGTNGHSSNGQHARAGRAHQAPPAPLSGWRATLRGLPVFASLPPAFDPDAAPGHPVWLFAAWLQTAIDTGVPEPHAMTLSTCGDDGRPDARVLILKDLTADGFWFATSARSAKGRQLAANQEASLTFYWPSLARQVRVRGRVEPAGLDESAADFRARGVGARAVALASHESEPLHSRQECADAVASARARLDATPSLVASMWALCLLRLEQVEFWQADPDRQHTRLAYTHLDGGWTRTLLWP